MSRYALSPRAKRDVQEIWDYSAQTWNADQADTYNRAIEDAVALIADDPRRGRTCDELRRGYYRFPVGSHVIFYRVSQKATVVVIRILHARMDHGRYL